MSSSRGKWKTVIALALVLLVAFLLMSSHLGAPFDYNHIGFTGAWYSLSARNFLRYGPAELYFCLTTESGPVVADPTLYPDHPAGISLLLAATFKVFGEGELPARTTALALSLGAVLFFFLFQQRLFKGPGPALFGTLLAVSAPSWAIYGSLADPHGPSLLFAMAGALWAVLRWSESGSGRNLALVIFFLILGCLFDWAACLIAGPIGLWALVYRRERPVLARLSFWVVPALFMAGLIVLGCVAAAKLGGSGDLFGALANRCSLSSNLPDSQGAQVSFLQAITQVGIWHYKSYFLPLALLGWLASCRLIFRLGKGKAPPETALILVPSIMGLALGGLFLQALFEHEYLQIYFVPGLAMATAWLLARQLEKRPVRRRLLIGLALGLVAISLTWGFHRSRLRWRIHEPGLPACRVAGEKIAAATAPGDFILAADQFFPPLAYYSDRRFYWQEEIPPDLSHLGGILLTDKPAPRLEKILQQVDFTGPAIILDGRFRLWLKR